MVFPFDDSLISRSQNSRSTSPMSDGARLGTGLMPVVVTTGGFGSGLMLEEETSGELSSPTDPRFPRTAALLVVVETADGVSRSLTIFLMSMSDRSPRRRRLTRWPGLLSKSSSRVWFSHSSTRGSTLNGLLGGLAMEFKCGLSYRPPL